MMENASTPIHQLPTEQLHQVRQEIEQDLNVLTNSFGQLKRALGQFQEGLESTKNMKPENSEKQILVPLTQSLYVPGVLTNVDKVIVDVGTGYFVEMSIKDASAFYSRKILFIKESLDKLEIAINQKQDQRGYVVETIKKKTMIEQRIRQQAAGSGNVDVTAQG